MAQTDDIGRYPQSTPKGDPIPYEIVRPLGLVRIAVQDAAVNGVAIPDAYSFLVLRSSAACFVRLNGNAAIPALSTYTANYVYVDVDEVIVIDHNMADTLGVIKADSTDDDGVLVVQVCETYKDIRKTAQLDRM
jgi:hypothetical protein